MIISAAVVRHKSYRETYKDDSDCCRETEKCASTSGRSGTYAAFFTQIWFWALYTKGQNKIRQDYYLGWKNTGWIPLFELSDGIGGD